MLQLINVCKSYTTADFTQTALDHVSVAFRDNEFVAVLGPSGSGKTTMLNIIGGLDHYDGGNLLIDGVSTSDYKDRDWDAYRNNRIGFVFQAYNLIPHQTILENVELALTLSGVSRVERRQRAIEALGRVGLAEHVSKKPSQLSGGQMQRVAIARALINDPEILLADEPTGALDSKTSVQIMDLLTEIADDRLVIMVTHNPELAQRYATRIVTLADGVIRDDTRPFDPAAENSPRRAAKQARRTSMSFLTALSLSFKNLLTKKGRTLMTAFAGSIGIIGIAAILSLANGVNSYIANVEEETLSEYPLQIQDQGFDMTSMMGLGSGSDGSSSEKAQDDASDDDSGKPVHESKMIASTFDSIGSNDLASLKKYLDSGESGVEPYVSSIEYGYSVTPQIFSSDTSGGAHQVNPDKSFASIGLGSSTASNGIMSSMMSTNIFYKLPDNMGMVEGQYDVMAGHWPENYDEIVLVLTPGGSVSDFMLYSMGLRDHAELESMVRAFANEEAVNAPSDSLSFSYDDLMGVTFKLVNAADFYQRDNEYGVWKDKSGDDAYMGNLVDNGETLKIAGVVKPKEGAKITSLQTGLYYPSSLVNHLIDQAGNTQIVQDQKANPATNVITGKSFADAFQMNMDENELAELMASLMSTEQSSYDNNMKKLGWADYAKPASIDIYPKDFPSKQNVIDILDNYNDRMESNGEEGKVVSYTDIVGALMSSVTTIVNMISYVLVAFVAISLVVSSIMIGVITYISVLERKKEIGILRSIGASKGDISRVFNAETIIVGFTAGVIGIGLTALACIPANAIVYSLFDVRNVAILPWQAAVVLVGISVLLTFLAGLIPSSAASRKDPVEALRSE